MSFQSPDPPLADDAIRLVPLGSVHDCFKEDIRSDLGIRSRLRSDG